MVIQSRAIRKEWRARRAARGWRGLRNAALISALSVSALGGTAAAATAGHGQHAVAKASSAPAITVAYDDTPDVGDLPSLVAIQMMRSQGYDIKEDVLNGPAAVADAIQAGDVQIGTMNGVSLFQAVASGDPFVMFTEKYANEIVLVTKSSIKTTQQLNGATIGVESPTASSTSLMLYTERALHVKVNLVYITGSAARMSAMLTGQLAGSPLELDDVVKILGTDPTKFHILINFDKEFPWLLGNVFFASRNYISKNSKIIQAYTTDLYAAVADAYAHPQPFIKKYGNLLTGYTQKVLDATMTMSAQEKIWGDDATIQVPSVSRTLSFDKQDGLLTAAQVAKLQSTLKQWFYPSFDVKAAQEYKSTSSNG